MYEMSHEEIELKSPFPVIPPLKDSKWNDYPRSPDGHSQPVEPPKLYPDIGEPHPCPYFVGPDVTFIHPNKRRKKPPVVPTPVIPPPVISPVLPSSIPESNDLTSEEENAILDSCLEDCLHGVVWEFISEYVRNMTREMYTAMVSKNPKRYSLDRSTLFSLWRKISKYPKTSDWTEKCEQPIDKLKLDILACQAYRLSKARFTVTNEGISDFHRKMVSQATSNNLVDLYSSDMDKKLKKQDPKDLKQQPPRYAS